MAAVRYRFRAELRQRWRAWLGLGLLVGVAGGAVLAAAAGALRTDTAYARFLDAAEANDFSVESFGPSPEVDYDALERLPGVAASGRYTALGLIEETPDGGIALASFLSAASDGKRFYTVDRPKLLEGRLPARDRAREVLVNRTLADQERLGVGDTIELLTTTQAAIAPYADAPDLLTAVSDAYREDKLETTRVRFTITGVGLFPGEVAQDIASREARLVVTPAFTRQMKPVTLWTLVGLRLRPGADASAVRVGIERVTAEGGAHVTAQADTTRQVERSVGPYATALALFAGFAGIASVLIVGQALARQARLDATSDPILRALGLTARQRVGLATLRAVVVAAVGMASTVLLAVAISPVTPIGPVRMAEPDPGVAFDAMVLLPGAVGVLVVPVAWAAITAWLRTRRVQAVSAGATFAESDASRLVAAVGRAGAPATLIIGIRMAVRPGRGLSAVPLRTTVASAAIAVAALVAVLTFDAGVDRLVDTPRHYGWNWDAAIAGNGGYTFVGVDEETGDNPVEPVLEDDAGAEAWAFASYGSVLVDRRGAPAVGIDVRRGAVYPTVLDGRPPSRDNEVVLGSTVLRTLGKDVGDTVEVAAGRTERRMRVVGRAVFPSLGFVDVVHTALGDGVLLTASALGKLEPDAYPNAVLVRLRDGPAGQQLLAQLHERFDDASTLEVLPSQPPGEVEAYDELQWTPLLLVGLLGVLGVGTLAHALISATRRRRRDLAVLKTLGFTRRQVSAVVAWHATTVGVIALLIALPLGVVLGRLAWRVFADRLGIGTPAVVPVIAVLALVPIALAVANAVAFIPGRVAGGLRPAAVLRSE